MEMMETHFDTFLVAILPAYMFTIQLNVTI